MEYRLARASSLGGRVLSKQIRSAFVPILYLSPIAKSAPHFTSRLPKPGRGEQELQCSLGKVQTELRNVVEELAKKCVEECWSL